MHKGLAGVEGAGGSITNRIKALICKELVGTF